MGYSFTALQKLDDAKVQYQKAIELNPKMSEAYLNLGLTLLDSDPAGELLHCKKRSSCCRIMGGQNSRWARPAGLLAGKVPEAIAQYQEAEKIDPKDFDTHFALGHLLLGAKRPAEAEAEFRAALAIQNDSSPARLGVAQSLVAEKKPEEAAAIIDAYLEKVPGDRQTRFQRASLLFDAGKYDECLAELDRAANGGPEALVSLKLRAAAYGRKKQYAEAIPVLQKAIALAATRQVPNLPAGLGHAYLQKKDYATAVHELNAAMKVSPTSLDVLSDLAAAEYLSKNYSAALALLDILSKHEELPYGTWFIRATCYDRLSGKWRPLSMRIRSSCN